MEIQIRTRVFFQHMRIVTPVPIQRPLQRLPLSLLLDICRLGQLCGFMEQRTPYNSHQLTTVAGFGPGVVVVKTDMLNRRPVCVLSGREI
jgi:hypothetical protein